MFLSKSLSRLLFLTVPSVLLWLLCPCFVSHSCTDLASSSRAYIEMYGLRSPPKYIVQFREPHSLCVCMHVKTADYSNMLMALACNYVEGKGCFDPALSAEGTPVPPVPLPRIDPQVRSATAACPVVPGTSWKRERDTPSALRVLSVWASSQALLLTHPHPPCVFPPPLPPPPHTRTHPTPNHTTRAR